MDKYKIRYMDVVRATNLSENWVFRFMTNHVIKPNPDKLLKVKEYFDSLETKYQDNKNTTTFPEMFEKIQNVETHEEVETSTTVFPENGDPVVVEIPRVESQELTIPTCQIVPACEDVLANYENEINDNNEIIELYEKKIEELKIRNKVCEEVITALKKVRGE